MATNSNYIHEWWLQRISAVIIAAYVLLVLALLLVSGAPNAAQWQALFAHGGFKLATLLALIAIAYHGLIGALHVWPDYVKNRALLAVLNAYSWLAAAATVLWAVYILFGLNPVSK
ncbi:MAG: succinate dehydrogenase, hydrophobic membrane anchor protein [Burkholderiales bacterium]|nr:succinate dehydrogenase, hydrophobic membrane anchor protein [Pseudomonadota bacterium]MCC7068245.1 succinate dehydrogenase, hydrophobic membrane anchor protein [Burkholderiales bacterium]MCZ2134817.1 succinate dehydrogenase, hydrophobic membrane anchor protein [Burkholderiales bacterium]